MEKSDTGNIGYKIQNEDGKIKKITTPETKEMSNTDPIKNLC